MMDEAGKFLRAAMDFKSGLREKLRMVMHESLVSSRNGARRASRRKSSIDRSPRQSSKRFEFAFVLYLKPQKNAEI
jgi:hypothetical protein